MVMGQAMVMIDDPACTGCDLCIPHCPFEALLPLTVNPVGRRRRPVIVVESHCVGCLTCIGSCPTGALTEITNPPDSKSSPLMANVKSLPVERVNRWGPNGLGIA